MPRPRKPKKGDGKPPRKPPQRTGKPLHLWIPEALRDALDGYAEHTRRPITTEVIIALEKHLEAGGFWPPPPPPPADE